MELLFCHRLALLHLFFLAVSATLSKPGSRAGRYTACTDENQQQCNYGAELFWETPATHQQNDLQSWTGQNPVRCIPECIQNCRHGSRSQQQQQQQVTSNYQRSQCPLTCKNSCLSVMQNQQLQQRQNAGSSCPQACMFSCQPGCAQQRGSAAQVEPQYPASSSARPATQFQQQSKSHAESRYHTQTPHRCSTSCTPYCSNECTLSFVTQSPRIYYVSASATSAIPSVSSINGQAYEVPWLQQRQQSVTREISIDLPQFLRYSPFCLALCGASCTEQCVQQGRPLGQCSTSCNSACQNTCQPESSSLFPSFQPQNRAQQQIGSEYQQHNQTLQSATTYFPATAPVDYQQYMTVRSPSMPYQQQSSLPQASITYQHPQLLTDYQSPATSSDQEKAYNQQAPSLWQMPRQTVAVQQVSAGSYQQQLSSHQQEEPYQNQSQPVVPRQVGDNSQYAVTYRQQLSNGSKRTYLSQVDDREPVGCIQQVNCACPPSGFTDCPDNYSSRRRCCPRK